MNNQQSYPPLEINSLAEGTEEINEPMELLNWRMPALIVYGDLAAEGHSSEEIHQVGIEHEGRDDIDAQDAARTMIEADLSFLNRNCSDCLEYTVDAPLQR